MPAGKRERSGSGGCPAVDERDLDQIVIAWGVTEKAAAFADHCTHARQMINVAGKLTKRTGDGFHDMLV
jgi:hypothetical protein